MYRADHRSGQTAPSRADSAPDTAGSTGVVNRKVGRQALAAMVELVPDAMVIVDGDDGRIVAVNDQTERLFGCRRDDLVGQPVECLLPERYRRLHVGHRASFVAEPHHRPMGTGLKFRGRRHDGSEFPVDITLGPVAFDDERLVAAIVRDVTEWNRADALQAQLAAIVESSDDAIIAKDPGGTILSWNQGATRIYGYGPEEVIGRRISILAAPDRQDEIPDLLAAIAAGERVDHYETVRRRKDGALIDVSVTISPIRDEDGTIVGASTITRDVTDRRLLDSLRRDFISNAAHELRTPLAVIASLAEVLANDLHAMSAEKLEQCLEALRRQGHRAGVLVANLLDLSQLEQGTARLKVEPLNADTVIRQALRTAPPPDGKTVTNAVGPGLRLVADPLWLGQVMANLLSNAYRYGGQQITIEGGDDGRWVNLTVADDGPGVPADFVTKLFDPFTRVTDAEHPPGSGIGLAICRRVVQAMGGNIWYEPGRPAGARFVLSLPAPGSCSPDRGHR